jgi:hypothetical protein
MTEPENQPYRESEDFVPRSTDITDQLDTTGLGGPSRLRDVAPIVGENARQTFVEASQTLKDGGLHASGVQTVILPGDSGELLVDQERRAAAEQQIHDKADELRADGAQTPAEIQAARFAAGAAPAGGDPITPVVTDPTTPVVTDPITPVVTEPTVETTSTRRARSSSTTATTEAGSNTNS